ncbi:MAG TPA: SprT-like domain-containing protein [Arenicellales bacterium]|nr:SprT-like domain-containing protein [Arenicellales bacterium]
MRPTRELYDYFSRAYDHFNRTLFDGALAPCMLTVQRQKGCMGLFYPERWVAADGVRCHELALNPTYFGASRVIELFQTLVHEQCHMWQQEFGQPSRSGYHNREWAAKMEAVGLMPSSTGEPGGRRTGQHMSDYALPDGRFLAAARAFMAGGETLQWLDRYRVDDKPRSAATLETLEREDREDDLLAPVTAVFAATNGDQFKPLQTDTRRNKIAYTCAGCGARVWGKPELRIRCEDCDAPFRADG